MKKQFTSQKKNKITPDHIFILGQPQNSLINHRISYCHNYATENKMGLQLTLRLAQSQKRENSKKQMRLLALQAESKLQQLEKDILYNSLTYCAQELTERFLKKKPNNITVWKENIEPPLNMVKAILLQLQQRIQTAHIICFQYLFVFLMQTYMS